MRKLLILILSLAFLPGCTPKAAAPSVQIQFPDWAQLDKQTSTQQKSLITSFSVSGTPSVSMIAINASGDGVTNLVPFQWKRKSDAETAPLSASFEVAKGALVQVLAVIEGTGSSRFYYGEGVVSTTGGDSQTLQITITNIAATQSSIQGRIAGRYLTGPNQGPTGVFQYRFFPEKVLGPGHPSMVVTTGEVFSGWMSVFAMSSPLLQYTWADGTIAFDTSLASNALLSKVGVNPARSARITLPSGYVNDAHSDTSFKMVPRDSQEVTAGFFGPYADSVTGLRLCVDDIQSADVAPRMYDFFAQTTSTDPSVAPSNPMIWSSQLASSGGYILDSNVLGGTYVRGGTTSSSCRSGGSQYADYLVLDGTRLAQGEDVLGFRGPFSHAYDRTDGPYFYRSFNSYDNSLWVSWSLLPGVKDSIGGLSLFYRTLSTGASISNDDDLRENDGFKCNSFGKSAAFANAFTELSVPGVGIGTTMVQIMNVPDQATADRMQIVACPKANDGSFFNSGAMVSSGTGDCRPSSAALTEFEIVQDTILLPATFVSGLGTTMNGCATCHGEGSASPAKAVFLLRGSDTVHDAGVTLQNFCAMKAKSYTSLYHPQDFTHSGGVYSYTEIPSYYGILSRYFY